MKRLIFRLIVGFWNVFPFKSALRDIISPFNNIKEKLYKDLRFRGEMAVSYGESKFHMYNPGFTTIENEIYWNGLETGWESQSLKIWSQLAAQSNLILDIGANTGVYSLVAASVNQRAKIMAFEPVKRTGELLKRNVALNPSFSIEVFDKAVSNQSEVTTFYDVDSPSQYSASLNSQILENVANRVSYPVETVDLDSFFDSSQKVDLVKLDVEMHEPAAIEGMLNMIKRDQPSFLIEILTDEIASKVQELLSDIPYCIFSIDESTAPVRLEKIERSGFYNILLITEDKLDIVKLQ